MDLSLVLRGSRFTNTYFLIMKMLAFDLETLGNNARSPIIQIGAVKFDVENGIYDSFHKNVYYPYGIPKDYECDYSTIMWWMEQVQKEPHLYDLLNCEKGTLFIALTEFLDWVGDADEYLYWSMSTFDAPIIQHALETEISPERKLPFRNFRDYRTIKDILNLEYPEFKGVKHNALDDAVNEAELIIQGLKKCQWHES